MPHFNTLDDASVEGKRVVIRVDLNVPIEKGKVTDATRIERVVPTLRELLDKKAAVIVLAHFDRPKGKVVPEMSLKPVAPALEKILGRPVKFVATDWLSKPDVKVKPGECVLLENTRFHPGEEKNDADFAMVLGSLGDIFVNDAFSAAHRAHSSTEGIAHTIPAYAGRAMEAELKALEQALGNPMRPVVAVVGGAKVSSKLELLGNLSSHANMIVIGGGMANTFLAAQGFNVGKSLCEHDLLATAKEIMATAKSKGCMLILPTDVVVAKEFKAKSPSRNVSITQVEPDDMILDVGKATIATIQSTFYAAKTIVWNGPLGAFEVAPFDAATIACAKLVAQLTKSGKVASIAGGGDTVAALNHAGVAKDFTYISTAGGAFLEWLEGKSLPGVKALERKPIMTTNKNKLADIAQRMVTAGKGILAADESTGSIGKRLESINTPSTPDTRRDYREMLFGATDAMKAYISGVILYDETIRQKGRDGTPLVDMIKATGAIAGIKLDTGAKPMALCPGETITEGLDGLADRVAEYAKIGAEFAKWRAVIDIGKNLPSHNAIHANAHALARYAAICQAGGIVPMVEPEVLMDGDHDIDTCMRITEWVLKEQFQELYYAGVKLEGIILKPNMVISGKKCAVQASHEEVAEKTLIVLKRCVPSAVPGIAFLSGGQSSQDATAHLHYMNAAGPLPWKLTFSYGRALQADALKSWMGKDENKAIARAALSHRAQMNALAATGKWSKSLEK